MSESEDVSGLLASWRTRAARAENRRRPHIDHLALLPAAVAAGDLRFDRAHCHPHRSADADL